MMYSMSDDDKQFGAIALEAMVEKAEELGVSGLAMFMSVACDGNPFFVSRAVGEKDLPTDPGDVMRSMLYRLIEALPTVNKQRAAGVYDATTVAGPSQTVVTMFLCDSAESDPALYGVVAELEEAVSLAGLHALSQRFLVVA